MDRFLVITFEYCRVVYHSLILCKAKNDGTEYRITVMNGEIEKQLCNNNTIKETKGCIKVELSGNKLQNDIKRQIAKALGKITGIPVEEVETPEVMTADRIQVNEVQPA